MLKKSLLILLLLLQINLLATSEEEAVRKVKQVLDKTPSGTVSAVLIYNPLTQDTLFSVNHKRSMIPASITKLFTTSTALSLMGGDHKLSTKLLSEDENFSDGVIDGDLYIKGFGNGTFTTSDLDEMVSELKRKGIKKIDGNVVGDDSYFDNIYTRDDWIPNEKANVKLPPISALVIDKNQTTERRKRRRRFVNYTVDIKNPPLHIANQLYTKLSEAGIEIDGISVNGFTSPKAKPFLESSVELRDYIARVNKHSDNFLAEVLYKTIGAAASGKQGNSFYSTQAVLTFIEDNGIYKTGTEVVDGSGISRFDQVTVGAVVGLLEKMYFDLVHFDDFYNSLSIAGVDGTLSRRMWRTKAQNNFRGKTGTLNGVSSLCGYLTTEAGDDLIVGIIFEFKRGSWRSFRNLQDEIIEALAEIDK